MPDAPPPMARDARLDVFRGLCLAMIFINHVPGTIYEHLTSRNFGFSDAAEGFVIMSGVAAGLAYMGGFSPRATWSGARRVWMRAFTLYQVHLMVTLLAVAISAAATIWFNSPRLMHSNEVSVLFDDPLGFMFGVPLMTHQLGYANILPMYMMLLVVTPPLLVLARRWPLWVMAGSMAVWFVAGVFRINLPNYPNAGGWFFNPFAWQLLFVVGLLTGVALRQGRRFVPVHRGLQAAACLILLVSLISVKWPAFSAVLGHGLWLLAEQGVPFHITSFDKTFVAMPRMLHILALAYMLSSLPVVRKMAATQAAAPLALLGRHGLLVFAAGTVLAFLAQAIRDVIGGAPALDSGLIVGGLGLQLGLAALADRWKRQAKARRSADPSVIFQPVPLSASRPSTA